MNCFKGKCETCAYQGEGWTIGGTNHCSMCVAGCEYKPMSVESLYPKSMFAADYVNEYICADIKTASDLFKQIVNDRYGYIMRHRRVPTIKNVIFNEPATIVFWSDGTKTVVKTQNGDEFDPEKGLAMAIAKKALGNEGRYFNDIKKWTDKYYANYEDVSSKLKKLAESIDKLKIPKIEPYLKITFNAKTHKPVAVEKPLTYTDIYKDFLEHYPSMRDVAENQWTAALTLLNSIYINAGGKRYVYSYDSKFLSPVAD